MATQTIEFRSPPSQTITAKLFAIGSDTVVATQSTTEATNRKGTYSAAFTDVAAGTYELIAFVSTTPVARWYVALTLTTATFQATDTVTVESAISAMRGADNDTLKTLSDQIDGVDSGGLTVDQAAALTRIDNKTALITGAKLSVAGAVTPGGDITIVIGDDRLVAADSELIRTITDTGGALFARLDDAASITFGAGRNGVADLITGTVTAAYASNVTTLTIEIDHADISADAIDSEDYTYQIQRITSGGDCVIEVSGNLTLLTRYVSRG